MDVIVAESAERDAGYRKDGWTFVSDRRYEVRFLCSFDLRERSMGLAWHVRTLGAPNWFGVSPLAVHYVAGPIAERYRGAQMIEQTRRNVTAEVENALLLLAARQELCRFAGEIPPHPHAANHGTRADWTTTRTPGDETDPGRKAGR